MASYKKIAKEQHKLIMQIIEKGLNEKAVKREVKQYCSNFLNDKDYLKLI